MLVMTTATEATTAVELLTLVMSDADRVARHADEWISVRLLALAAVLLPVVGVTMALPRLDVPESLRDAAVGLGLCDDRRQAGPLVCAAEDMLASHLIGSFLAVPAAPGAQWTLETWLRFTPVSVVVAELQAAAWFNRLRLLADELCPDGLCAYLAASPGWSGAVVAARDHPFSVSGCFGSGQP